MMGCVNLVGGGGCTWYTVPGARSDLAICEACRTNLFAETRFDGVLESTANAGMRMPARCGHSRYHPLLDLVEGLESRHADLDEMCWGLVPIADAPRCHRDGPIIDGPWYDFEEGVPEFGICEAHYTGTFLGHGMTKVLAAAPKRTQGRFWCTFNSRMLQVVAGPALHR